MNQMTKMAVTSLLAAATLAIGTSAIAANTATPAANADAAAKCDKAAMGKHLSGAAKDAFAKKCMEKPAAAK
jgi:hypothetical protein